MVFQHFSLFEALTVAENIALAMPRETDTRALSATIRQVSSDYGLPLNPDTHIADLSVGERQRVEIVRCLLQNPELIIMDEPNSSLTSSESERLFDVIRSLQERDIAIVYVSHKIDDVLRISNRISVLRDAAPVVAPLGKLDAALRRGDSARVEVVVRTRNIGHFFPGGTVDATVDLGPGQLLGAGHQRGVVRSPARRVAHEVSDVGHMGSLAWPMSLGSPHG